MASERAGEMHGPENYPRLGELGVVGDGRSLAVVGADGGIEWFCPLRFDGPPLVWPLLDRARGGRLRIAPIGAHESRMRYLEETALLELRWRSGEGEAIATLGMDWSAPGRQRLLWEVRGIRGSMPLRLDFVPRPDFGRAAIEPCAAPGLLALRVAAQRITLQSPCALERRGEGWQGAIEVRAGETAAFCLGAEHDSEPAASPLSEGAVAAALEASARRWREWCGGIAYAGAHRAAVVRSAITLKLLIHEPSGAVVAAATTSLPEVIGGERNWDYRFAWFRDGGMTLDALYALGRRREARRWARWMQDTIERHGTPLRPFYAIDGGHACREAEFPELAGYRDSRPVRSGNSATGQHQLDVYGEVMNCVFICDAMDDAPRRKHWPHLRMVADFIAQNWRDPDAGIWEARDRPRHYVHSKVMAWAGLQRALWLQRRHPALEGDSVLWREEAAALRRQIMDRGRSRDGRYFVRAYGDDRTDASLLLLARAGFVDPDSPLFRATVDAVRRELTIPGSGGLLRRYRGPDGLEGTEGAFVICGFWMVRALVLTGQRADAVRLFERLLSLAGKLGLYAEEADPGSGAQLGNFPQAFSHVGLIHAALLLANRDPEQPGGTAESDRLLRLP